MRVQEIISEVLDITGPAPETNWHTSYGGDTSTGKWVDPTGKEVNTLFDKDGRGGADVSFSRDQVAAKHKGITVGGGRPSYNVTGTGDGTAPKILTGVIQNIKNYLDKNPDVNQIKFISVDPSRTKAYSRMVDRLAPTMGLVGTRTDRGSNETEFVLKRAQPSQKHVPLVNKEKSPSALPTPLLPTNQNSGSYTSRMPTNQNSGSYTSRMTSGGGMGGQRLDRNLNPMKLPNIF